MSNQRVISELSGLTLYAEGKQRLVCDRLDHVLFEYTVLKEVGETMDELLALAWAVIDANDDKLWEKLLSRLED